MLVCHVNQRESIIDLIVLVLAAMGSGIMLYVNTGHAEVLQVKAPSPDILVSEISRCTNSLLPEIR